MDNACTSREKVECVSHALPQTYPGNHMAGQGDKKSCAGKGWDTKFIHSLKAKTMRWLGHVPRMKDGRIPKDLLYGELARGKRPTERPQVRFK